MKHITAYKCTACDQVMFPRHHRCVNCGAREFEAFHPSDKAKLLTYTVIEQLPWGIDERGRILGVVEFSNKVRAMGMLDIPEEDVKTGMNLSVFWEPVRVIMGEKAYGLVFRQS